MIRFARRLLVVAATFGVTGVMGCGDEAASSSEDLTQSNVAFTVLDVARSNAEEGLTLIKSKAAYAEFFGEAAPSDVDFKKHWVIHYSMGVRSSGGFSTEITSVRKTGSSSKRKLVVTTEDVSPGPECVVTLALTNPQMTVRVNKQTDAATATADTQVTVTDCGEPECPNPVDPRVEYIGDSHEDPSACTALKFACDADQTPFTNECGCGCVDQCADPESPRVHYAGDSNEDPSVCTKIKFACDPGQILFSDACGCGCLDTVVECAPVLCELFCEDGFATDDNGCEVCSCA